MSDYSTSEVSSEPEVEQEPVEVEQEATEVPEQTEAV